MLKDDVKIALRVSTSLTDAEVQTYIDTALFDLKNKGVDESFLEPQDDAYEPIVKTAIICYCKAMYGYDKSESTRFMRSYESILNSLVNGKQNAAYGSVE